MLGILIVMWLVLALIGVLLYFGKKIKLFHDKTDIFVTLGFVCLPVFGLFFLVGGDPARYGIHAWQWLVAGVGCIGGLFCFARVTYTAWIDNPRFDFFAAAYAAKMTLGVVVGAYATFFVLAFLFGGVSRNKE
jgi:hypothetical protein